MSDVERALGDPALAGALERLMPRQQDPWAREFPGLASLPPASGEMRSLRIAIATEDIAGPSRNGGIGTTYAALATHLAALGHDVTILHLHAEGVENDTLERWIEDFAERGVTLAAVPDHASRERFRPTCGRWLRLPYNLMRYLAEHPFDVVHSSEWRGAAYLALMAKRQGLAFQDTLFLVKASSPLLWQRRYALQPLSGCDELTQAHGERCCVEWADAVIGGSHHLMRWMAAEGYRLPERRTFVQPNIVDGAPLRRLAESARRMPGGRIAVEEIAFFGRLESRKGLVEFCRAISRLARQGQRLPGRISFLGKPGEPLPGRPDITILQFIAEATAHWPTEVVVKTDLQQPDALAYLTERPVLAVMPSIIENSSLALYEALLAGVPFIASDTGGNPELVTPADHAAVLCAPHPVPLAERIGAALGQGALIARPAFDMGRSNAEWARFHTDLGRGLSEALNQRQQPNETEAEPVGVCIYASGDAEELSATLATLARQRNPAAEILIGVDAPAPALRARLERAARESGLAVRLVDADDLGPGAAGNLLAAEASSPLLLFLWAGARLHEEALGAFADVARRCAADLVSCFTRIEGGGGPARVIAPLPGSAARALHCGELSPFPLLLRRASFLASGGFTRDPDRLGAEQELMTRMQLEAYRCELAPMELASLPFVDPGRFDVATSAMRAVRPLFAAAPLALRDGLICGPAPSSEARGSSAYGRTATDPAGPLGLLEPPPTALAALPPAERHWRRAHALPLAPESPYTGGILGVLDGVIHGWARDERNPTCAVELSAIIGGAAPIRVVAEADPAFALHPPSRIRGHGFALRVPRWWMSLRATPVELRIADDGALLAALEVAAPFARLASAGLEGFCDIGDGSALRGWVWRRNAPEDTVDVAVFVDGRFLARKAACLWRPDLLKAGKGTGEHGFSVAIPSALRSGATHRIDVVTAQEGLRLRHGRLRLRGNLLTKA